MQGFCMRNNFEAKVINFIFQQKYFSLIILRINIWIDKYVHIHANEKA